MPSDPNRSRARALLTDIQLWIPLLALAVGVVVLRWVR
jgi:hypothetical protein